MPIPSHEHRIRVRYAETDQMGVVYHANYLVFMEEGRTRLMESLGFRYADLERQGIGLAVHHVSVDFRASARYDDEVIVRTAIDRVRSASLNFRYELRRAADGTVLATGVTHHACLDLSSSERPIRALPDALRAALADLDRAPA